MLIKCIQLLVSILSFSRAYKVPGRGKESGMESKGIKEATEVET